MMDYTNTDFDYFELYFSNIAKMSDDNFKSWLKHSKRILEKIETVIFRIPPVYNIHYSETNFNLALNYAYRSTRMAAQIGAKLIVIGSGDARAIPSFISANTGYNNLIRFFSKLSLEAYFYGINIAIEPLAKCYCPTINTIRESIELLKVLRQYSSISNTYMIIDNHHMHMNKEDLSDIGLAHDYLCHIHLRNPNLQTYPDFKDGYDYLPILKQILQVNYNGRISLEAKPNYEKITQAENAITFIKSLFNRLEMSKTPI